jgi:hypothetical protein
VTFFVTARRGHLAGIPARGLKRRYDDFVELRADVELAIDANSTEALRALTVEDDVNLGAHSDADIKRRRTTARKRAVDRGCNHHHDVALTRREAEGLERGG